MARIQSLSKLAVACVVLCAAAVSVQSIDTDVAISGTARRELRQAPATTPEAQKKILLQSKAMLAGGEKGLKLLASWTEASEMCADPYDYSISGFYGVYCDDNNLVMGISMSGLESDAEDDGLPADLILTGQLPPSWAALTSLVYMDFMGRAVFKSGLPASWSALVNLESLVIFPSWHFSEAGGPGARTPGGLTGTLPATWASKLKKLQALELSGQQLSGPLPASWAGLKALESLDLKGNNITGQLPGGWSALTELESLVPAGNQLKGQLLASWAKLTNLYHLELLGNAFTGAVPAWLASIKGLGRLYIDNNKFTGALPADLFTKTDLVKFAAANNPALAGCVPKAMKTRADFTLVAYTDANYLVEDFYPLKTYTLVKNTGPLNGTKITGLCA